MKEQMKTLEGVKIIDFSHALSAPYGSMLLTDQGADVIKVENPRGDVFRTALGGAYSAIVNRNKRGICVNLKTDEGKEIIKKIILESDVLIENFIPGVIKKLGFGYETVKAMNPRLIYCSLSGFGQTGPYKNLGGYDVVAQAMSGVMVSTGFPDRPPVRIGPSIVDMGSGMYLAMGILLALMDRERTGKGQRIEISLLETALSWMAPFAAKYTMDGELPQRWGSGFFAFAPYQVFESSDGYAFVGVSTDAFWKAFCDAFDLKDLHERKEFSNIPGRLENREEINRLVQIELKKYTTADIIARVRKAGVPCASVNSIKDAMDDPHVKERDILDSMDHPECGPIKFVCNPIIRNGKIPKVRFPSPAIGEQTVEVLSELGYSDDEIEGLLSSEVAIAYKKK